MKKILVFFICIFLHFNILLRSQYLKEKVSVTMCMYLQIQVRKKLSLSEISHLQKKVYMHLR